MIRVVRGALAPALTLVLALVVLLSFERGSFAQLGGGPAPRHYPHAAPTPPPSPSGPGRIRLSLGDGERGPLVLTPKNGGFVGEFVVWNDGPGPLTVSRVTTRGDEDDPRLPPRFTARFADGGGGSAVIQPHSSKRVAVTWIPDREPKLHQALGHVVLTSNDEVAGEVAMGFVATDNGPRGFLTSRLLSLLLGLPLVVAIAAFAMQVLGYAEAARLRPWLVVATGLQCVLATVLYLGFDGAVTRADGNDGFQFIERSVLNHGVGVEYFVGVDGTSVSFVLLTALVGFVGAVASYGVRRETAAALARYYAHYAALLAALMAVFITLDLGVLFVSWVALLAAAVGLVASAAGPLRGRVVVKFGVYAGLSTLAFGAAVLALHLHSDPTFLADGVRVEHSLAIPELMRVAYNAKHLTLLGASFVKVVWSLLFLAFALVLPLVPLHGWFIDVTREVPAPVTLVMAALVSKAGLYGLLRVSFGILPDGSRWAATTLVAAGVLNVGFGAVLALRQRDLGPLGAYLSLGQLGFCLIGLGGLTREGLAGCLLQSFSQGMVTALVFTLVGSMEAWGRSSTVRALRGVGRQLPASATFLTLAFFALTGTPGLGGFWGEVLALLGAFPSQRLFVTLAAGGGVVAVAASSRVAVRLFLARGTARTSKRVTPDISSRELAAILPLVVLSVATGLYPASFLTLVQGGVSDVNRQVNPPGPDEIAGASGVPAVVAQSKAPVTCRALEGESPPPFSALSPQTFEDVTVLLRRPPWRPRIRRLTDRGVVLAVRSVPTLSVSLPRARRGARCSARCPQRACVRRPEDTERTTRSLAERVRRRRD